MMHTVFEELLKIPNDVDARRRSDLNPSDSGRIDNECFVRLITDNSLGDAHPDALPGQFDWSRLDDEVSSKPVEFVYDWEREFSEVLDDHQIQWRYKPRTFAVEWDQDGNFVDSFTPDFYLSEHDL